MVRKLLAAVLAGVVFITIPVFSIYAADEEIYESEIDYSNDAYITFGDDEHNPTTDYHMSLVIDTQSMSSQWVDMTVTIDHQYLLDHRDLELRIDKFLILANGKIVETFNPQWVDLDDNGTLDMRRTYNVKPGETFFIGGQVYFQVVAVDTKYTYTSLGEISADYALLWTGHSQQLEFDPLPVSDEDTHMFLNDILYTLRQILSRLESMENVLATLLNRIADEIATMFTPSPAAQERFKQAQQNLWNKMPMKEMADKTNQMSDMFKNTATTPAMSKLTFGEARDWFGVGAVVYLFDLSGLEEPIRLIRSILDAVIWVEFFMFLLFYLSPRLDL